MPYQIHTYKDILQTLHDIELDDQKLRNLKSKCVAIGVLYGLLTIGFLLTTSYNEFSLIELVTSFGGAISLGPVFGFVYYSTQSSLISQRKQEFWNSLINNFSNDPVTKFTNDKLDEQELQKVLIEKIKEKINESLKYEQ